MYVTRAFFVWTLQNDKKPLLSTHLPETSSSRKRKSHNLQPKHADEIHVKIECDEQKHNITSPSLKKQTAGKTTSVPSSVRKRKNIGVRCCVACGLIVKNSDSLKKYRDMHIAVHSGPNFSSCSVCGKSCTSRLMLHRHLARVHLVPYHNDTYARCCICRAPYSSAEDLCEHLKAHSSDQSTCPICKVTCRHEADLVSHLLGHTTGETPVSYDSIAKDIDDGTDGTVTADNCVGDETSATGSKPKGYCGICEKVYDFRGVQTLQMHALRHINKPGICPKCEEAFKTMSELKRHVLTHVVFPGRSCLENVLEATKPKRLTSFIQCKICGTVLINDLRSIARHLVTHVGPKFQCVPCNKYFDLKLNLSLHMEETHIKLHNSEVMVECRVCKVNFVDVDTVKLHLKEHCGGSNKCCVCAVKCEDESTLEEHLSSHVSNDATTDGSTSGAVDEFSSNTCTICGRFYFDTADLLLHIGTHGESAYYYCDICWFTCHEQDVSLSHVLQHQHGNTCSQCHVTSSSAQESREHMTTTHVKLAPKVEAITGGTNSSVALYVCDVCGSDCRGQVQLDEHYTRAHDVKRYVCSECAERFYTRAKLLCHQIRRHRTKRELRCKFCGSGFISKADLKLHIASSCTAHPLACAHCDYATTSKSCLRDHIASHHSTTRPYPCNECDATFATPRARNRHKRSHHKRVKQWACDQCDLAFRTRQARITHVMTSHRVIEALVCEVCGHTCKKPSDLKVRMCTHTDERPFACDKCTQTFKTICALRAHQVVHSDVRPFQCDQCQARFKTKHALTRHRHVHTRQHGDPNGSSLVRKRKTLSSFRC